MRLTRLTCVGLLILMGAAPAQVPQARLPLMPAAPSIDGVVDEQEWAGAARMERFAGSDGVLSPQAASFWLGCDGKELFVAVVSQTPPGGKILSRVTPLPENADARTWEDDSIEMVFDPLRTETTGRRRIYHANLNARAAIFDMAYIPGGGGEAWRGNWRTASTIVDDRWHFEAALPLKDMNVTDGDLNRPMGIRIVRNWTQRAVGPAQTEWSPLGGAYLSPDTMPLVTWDPQAPIVQMLQVWDADKLMFHPRLSIRNPHDKSLELKATIKSVPRNSAHLTKSESLTVAPGDTATFEMMGGSLPREDVTASIDVTSSDGSVVYYRRDYIIKLEQPDELWVLDENAAAKLDVSFAYFPYHDTIKAIVNINGLEEKDKVTAVVARLRGGGREIASSTLPPMQSFVTQMEWKIPPLQNGEYQLAVELQGLKLEPAVKDFVRHVMPWERNELGKSEVVMAPFEPIVVDGRRVRTILREHELGPAGLWQQVRTIDTPLLKSTMRLEVRAGEKLAQATGEANVVEQKPTGVTYESRWSAGEMSGTTAIRWDIDGMMSWTVDLPASGQRIDAMALIIPLDDSRMPLMHACTDGLRFNFAGATPSGQGRVWDGSKAARNSIIGSFVPYIWLGDEQRGLAVFGDNDRGWVRDPNVPCQEIVRNGETLELRLNLIAAPVTLDQPRRIKLAFQATPTKPMPAGWRSFNVNLDHHPAIRAASARGAAFLGCCWQWGSLTPYDDIYPRDEDFKLWEKFAEIRRSGNADWKYMEQFVAETKLPSESERESFRGNLHCGFHVCSTNPRNILAYTNPRGMRHDTPEGQTFLDEWHVEAFLSRKVTYGGGSSYGANPVESFRDYSMWYYKRMLETFVDDIYWDNVYLKACFDTVGTDAYEISPGLMQPSVGLFNMRELIRRTAVLGHEMNKRPVNMIHMTNTAIAPIMAFSHSHLTWEDRQGDSDFQDRYTREYLRAESIGLQHGSVPYALELIHGPDEKKNAWVRRTATGVMLTHEIKSVANSDPFQSCFQRLLEFGYGQDDSRVFNYWQDENPVRVQGADVTTLVVNRPGRAMIVVCDYGAGGENVTLAVDAKALGLRDDFTARDVESAQPLDTSGSSVRFALPRHDFRILLLE